MRYIYLINPNFLAFLVSMKGQEHITPIDQFLIDFVTAMRQRKGLTQEDIANIIGISRAFVADIENAKEPAKYNVRHINALADYFNLSPREFFPDKALALEFSEREAKDREKKAKTAGKKGRPGKADSIKVSSKRK